METNNETNDINEHDIDMIKNLNWQETDQLTIYKRDQEELNSGLPTTTRPPATSPVLVLCDLNDKNTCIQYNARCTYHAKVETKDWRWLAIILCMDWTPLWSSFYTVCIGKWKARKSTSLMARTSSLGKW